ncbi:MAG: LysR family transcriptional regulator [Gemmatimonadota bacterium]|jgi:DNA-binding transcriptional LysR family regulator
MGVDPRFLPTFLAVVEKGSFGAAAESLGVTQPAVSYRISQLEDEMGVALFERAGRRMILTAAGRALRTFCASYLTQLDALRAELAEVPVPPGEPIRISAVSGFGRYVLFPVLSGEPFRDLPLELLYHTAEEVFERVESGAAELGVVYRPKVSSYLDVRELCREELALIAPARGLSVERPGRPEDLEALPFVTYVESSYVFGAWFEHHFGRQPSRIHSVQRYEELEEVVAMVALGRGLSVVPLDCAGEALDDGRVLVVQPAHGPPCLNPVHAVTRSGAFVRSEVEAILAAVERRGTRRSRPGR